MRTTSAPARGRVLAHPKSPAAWLPAWLRRMLHGLFPPPPQGQTFRPGQAAAAFLAVAAVGLVRQVAALDTMWAEDGGVFLAQALGRSPAETLSTPWAGYLHVVPRLLTEAVAALPLRYAAAAFAVLGAAAAAALVLVVFAATAGHLESSWVRAGLAGALVFAPVARLEVLDNVVNLHWLLLPAAFWALLWQPRRRGGVAVGATVAALAPLSDPLALLLAPVALARLVFLRGRRAHVITAAWALGIATQLASIVLAQAPQRDFARGFSPIRLGGSYLAHAVRGAVTGDQLPTSGVVGFALLGVAVAVTVTLTVAGVRSARGREWALPGAAVTLSVAFSVVPVALTGVATPRYALFPALLLLTAAAWVLDAPEAGRLRLGAAALVGIVWGTGLIVTGPRAEGPRWSTELAWAKASCASADEDTEVTVAVSPEGWRTTLPCGRVR